MEATDLEAAVSWVFRDAAGKTFRTPAQLISNKRECLTFPLDILMKDGKPPFRVEQLEMERKTGNGTLRFHDSSFKTSLTRSEAVRFELETGLAIPVLKRGHETTLAYRFTNTAAVPGDFTFHLAMRHFHGDVLTNQYKRRLAPGESVLLFPEKRPEKLGHWDVECRITEASEKGGTNLRRSFAYLDPAGPTPERASGFLFGVCTHTQRWSPEDRKREYLAAALCGAKVVRTGVEWGGIQPERDQWNFTIMDELVETYGGYGMELQAIFGFCPKWAAAPEAQKSANWLDWARSKPEDAAWTTYIRTMAERYRGRIRYWEVWNEPDLKGFNRMTLEEYVGLQKAAFQELKRHVPEAIVMSGGFATMSDHPGRKSKTFHRDYLNLAKGFFAVHAIHEHGSFQSYADLIDHKFLPMRRQTGTNVPWYSNETAVAFVVALHAYDDERDAGAVKIVLQAPAFAIGRFIVFK